MDTVQLNGYNFLSNEHRHKTDVPSEHKANQLGDGLKTQFIQSLSDGGPFILGVKEGDIELVPQIQALGMF